MKKQKIFQIYETSASELGFAAERKEEVIAMQLDGGASDDEMTESISDLPTVSGIAYKRPSAIVSKQFPQCSFNLTYMANCCRSCYMQPSTIFSICAIFFFFFFKFFLAIMQNIKFSCCFFADFNISISDTKNFAVRMWHEKVNKWQSSSGMSI